MLELSCSVQFLNRRKDRGSITSVACTSKHIGGFRLKQGGALELETTIPVLRGWDWFGFGVEPLLVEGQWVATPSLFVGS